MQALLGAAGASAKARAQALEAGVDVVVAALDQAVGVEQQQAAGRHLAWWVRYSMSSKTPSGGVPSPASVSTLPSGRRSSPGGWPARTYSMLPAAGSNWSVEDGRHLRRVGLAHQAIEPLHRLGGRVAIGHVGAQRRADAPHHRRGIDAAAGDVADREPDRAVVERDDLVPVAADLEPGAAGS